MGNKEYTLVYSVIFAAVLLALVGIYVNCGTIDRLCISYGNEKSPACIVGSNDKETVQLEVSVKQRGN